MGSDAINARSAWSSTLALRHKTAGTVVTRPIFSEPLASCQPYAVSSDPREKSRGSGVSLGQKHQSTDDGQSPIQMMSSPTPKNYLGGKGGHFIIFWNLANLILHTHSSLGEQMKTIGIYLLSFACLALPTPKEYAAGQLSKKQYQCLHTLWTKESNWRSNAQSKTHDMGIPQRHMKHNTKKQQQKFLSDPLEQVSWGLNYIKIRYQTPCRALAAWMSRADHRGVGGWY